MLALGGGMTIAVAAFRAKPANAMRALLEGDAYAPWRLWDDASLRGSPLALVAAGVLAANPHDTQPWLFRIRGETIDVLADLSRNLGVMDAYVREMHLGLGCAIENMAVAAGPNGFDAEVRAGRRLAHEPRRAPRSRRCGHGQAQEPRAEPARRPLPRDRAEAHQSLRL